jgi:murein DD-endopeptidase MepM/ murein hydrolase activator NlpD
MMQIKRAFAGLLLVLAACSPVAAQPAAFTPSVTASASNPTVPLALTATITPKQTSTSTQAVTATLAQMICSPLDEITLAELPEILSNPFAAPAPGGDDGHHGTDFAFYRRGDRASIEGLAVRSVFAGAVAGVIIDRFPYGNMLVIETPLESLPAGWVATLSLPAAAPTLPPNPRLTCPAVASPDPASTRRSLYLLYAHLQSAPEVRPGDPVSCGDPIGAVGNTGKSGNPHLHLEARVGPSGWRFDELAHYENDATLPEMGNYCLWRVSGLFQMIDPLAVLLTPQ